MKSKYAADWMNITSSRFTRMKKIGDARWSFSECLTFCDMMERRAGCQWHHFPVKRRRLSSSNQFKTTISLMVSGLLLSVSIKNFWLSCETS